MSKFFRLLILILKLPVYIFCIFLSFFLLVINLFYKIKTYEVDVATFGHFFNDFNLTKIYSRINKFKVIGSVVGLKHYHNKYILSVVRKEFITSFLFKYLDFINRKMPWSKFVTIPNFRKESSFDLDGLVFSNPNLIFKFDVNEDLFCSKFLENRGIKKYDKFILLNLRDNHFYNQVLNYKADNSQITRNQIRIENCIKPLEYLSDKGFKIIRWGRFRKNIHVPSTINFYDFSLDETIPHILDVWLPKNCSFSIGTDSGPDTIVGNFNNLMCILGMWPLYYSRSFFKCITLPANARWLNSKKSLNLKEMCEFHSNENYIDKLKLKNVEFIKNSDDEIFDAIKQAFEIYEGKYNPSPDLLTKQEKYWSSFLKWDISSEKNYPQKKIQKRFMRFKHPSALIADAFLKEKKEDWFNIN